MAGTLDDSPHGLDAAESALLHVDRSMLRSIVDRFGAECVVVAKCDAERFMEFTSMGDFESSLELVPVILERVFAAGPTRPEVIHLDVLERHALVVPLDAVAQAMLIVLRTGTFASEESASIVRSIERSSSPVQRSWFDMMAHHVNNMAQTILGAAELTAQGEHDFLPEVFDAAERLGALGNALSIISAGRLSPSSSARSDSSELVATVRGTDFGSRGRAMLDRQLPDGPVLVASRRSLLVRMIREVVGNALDAAPARSIVELVVTADDASARVIVENELTARGDIGRFIEPFFTTKSSRHFGLGLTVARSLATAVGGQLVISEAGDRLRVEIVLPLAEVDP